MSNSETWAQALKIEPAQLAQWTSLAPDGVPLVVWLMEQGHIQSQEYLAWASLHYGLPIVQEEFFNQAFNEETLTSHINEGIWSPWQFPIEQWDGITIVACVEPPSPPLGEKFQIVLSDPRVLREVWANTAESVTAIRPMEGFFGPETAIGAHPDPLPPSIPASHKPPPADEPSMIVPMPEESVVASIPDEAPP
jgi:hypothetical protein